MEEIFLSKLKKVIAYGKLAKHNIGKEMDDRRVVFDLARSLTFLEILTKDKEIRFQPKFIFAEISNGGLFNKTLDWLVSYLEHYATPATACGPMPENVKNDTEGKALKIVLVNMVKIFQTQVVDPSDEDYPKGLQQVINETIN
jgi:hypothetical protein